MVRLAPIVCLRLRLGWKNGRMTERPPFSFLPILQQHSKITLFQHGDDYWYVMGIANLDNFIRRSNFEILIMADPQSCSGRISIFFELHSRCHNLFIRFFGGVDSSSYLSRTSSNAHLGCGTVFPAKYPRLEPVLPYHYHRKR